MQKFINSKVHSKTKRSQTQIFIPKTKVQASTYIETLILVTKTQVSTYTKTLILKTKHQALKFFIPKYRCKIS